MLILLFSACVSLQDDPCVIELIKSTHLADLGQFLRPAIIVC